MLSLLSQQVLGIKKVTIPNNKWTGFGFVEFQTQSGLDNFLAMGSIQLRGKELSIKPVCEGASLTRFKKDYDQRRLFVRIRAPEKIRPDLFSIFSQYGQVENTNLVMESEIIEKAHYTIIGFVLFSEESVVQTLAQRRRMEFDNFSLILDRIKSRDEDSSDHRPTSKYSIKHKSSKKLKKNSKGQKQNHKNQYFGRNRNLSNPHRPQNREELLQNRHRDQHRRPQDQNNLQIDHPYFNQNNHYKSRISPTQSNQSLQFNPQHQHQHQYRHNSQQDLPQTPYGNLRSRPTQNIRSLGDFEMPPASICGSNKSFHCLKPTTSDYFSYRTDIVNKFEYIRSIQQRAQFDRTSLFDEEVLFNSLDLKNSDFTKNRNNYRLNMPFK